MILEKVASLQIEEYFETNKLFGSFQFGFRKNKSTISEVLTLFDTLLEAKEQRKKIIILLYDLSSAFDTVCHEVLFKKLQSYGFDDHSISWMKSYLADRKQMVSMSGNLSTTQEIKVGVPQGSRLSPLLFICLMADLDLCVEKSMLSNFADDTQSIIVSDKKEVTLEITMREANNVLIFLQITI